jgi:hypothetical protein
MASVAATQSVELTGIHLALSVIVVVTLISVVLIWSGLRPRRESRSEMANEPESVRSQV